MKPSIRTIVGSVGALSAVVSAQPLAIDLTVPVLKAAETPIGAGTTKNPQGHTLTADNRSLFLDGVPWIPVCGEFHYSRYPRAEWRGELLKMKAGGIDTVSTYVFWNHHEEERGKIDWSGDRSLRDFIKLCQETGLKVIVRMGPWSHGEVRNGGFPDWVQNSNTKLRTKDPGFLKLVEPFFREQAAQMKGLLWKDGGPIIAAQMDNESHRGDYLLALKEIARSVGVDVPVYTITGWQGGVPAAGLLPLFGGYVDGFWGGKTEDYRKEFLFTNVRAMNDLGAQLTTKNEQNSKLLEQFPYACAEIGPGMMSSYRKRIRIAPEDPAALAMGKLGSGNNMPGYYMPGYYMYHGGVNPEGRLSTLQEEKPNAMPVKDYDFQTALGAAGEVRPQYHLLREQHLFIQDFGSALARMTVFLPEQRPADLNDFTTLRCSMRADETGSGFLFFSNRQPTVPMPDKTGVRFSLKSPSGVFVFPNTPIDIPSGAFGMFPVHLDCGGITLDYATAQPLFRLTDAGGATTFLFTAIEGIRPELALRGEAPKVVTPGTAAALTVKNPQGRDVSFVVLTPKQGLECYRSPFAGQTRAILSNAPFYVDGASLRLQPESTGGTSLAIFPPVTRLEVSGTTLNPKQDGLFSRFEIPNARLQIKPATATLTKAAGPAATSLKGHEEATWNDAAEYAFTLPETKGCRPMLEIHYIGDAARLYVGDKLFFDNFSNGDPMHIPLWRIPHEDWPKLRLKLLPCSDALLPRLPEYARALATAAKASNSLDHITCSVLSEVDPTVIKP